MMEYLISMLFGAIISATALIVGYKAGYSMKLREAGIEKLNAPEKPKTPKKPPVDSGPVTAITPQDIREEAQKPVKNKIQDLLGL